MYRGNPGTRMNSSFYCPGNKKSCGCTEQVRSAAL